jgi:uncharacterized protein
MTAIAAIFFASLLGSVHCAAMCGGFVCFYVGGRASDGSAGSALRWRAEGSSLPVSHAAYNLGRLLSYLVLGTIAGTAGKGIDRIGALAGVSGAAAVVAGAVMVAWGGSTIAAALGAPLGRIRAPIAAQRAIGGIILRVRRQAPAVRAVVVGLLTTLLPCGWLYAFVATAAGTGSAARGALVMFVFWTGTLPVMVSVGLGAQGLFGRFRRRLPLVSAAVVVIIGMLSILGHLSYEPSRLAGAGGAPPHAHVGR